MSEWPRIQTDVDDDRTARDDEVGYCQKCRWAALEDTLRQLPPFGAASATMSRWTKQGRSAIHALWLLWAWKFNRENVVAGTTVPGRKKELDGLD